MGKNTGGILFLIAAPIWFMSSVMWFSQGRNFLGFLSMSVGFMSILTAILDFSS